MKFEISTERRKKSDHRHHDQAPHTQKAIAKDVKSLRDTVERLGIPFCEDSGDLLILDSSDLVDPAVIDTARHIEKLGQDQYNMYVTEHRVNQTKHIYEPIKSNNLPPLQLASSPTEVKRTTAANLAEERLFFVLQAIHCLTDTRWGPQRVLST